ncbi:MAG: beta-ketoacyl-[acyl-carrier-protein] synthase family protein [Deltaproteobacteria bacterium]|nr:beta-ketoacyl-[acyl-carrier-protein] synthase family protein [Deltaproteobacteria bacterium]
MNRNTSKRVAITGLGIITSIGENTPAFKEGLFNGTCGIGSVSLFDTTGFSCHSAGEVRGRDLRAYFKPNEIKRISRCDLLGLIAAEEALLDSGLDIKKITKERVGVTLGGGAGGMLSWENYRRSVWLHRTVTKPSRLLASAPCTLTDLIAARYGLSGLRATICTACSSSATSIGYGCDLIRSGDLDLIVAGGSESLSELTFAGFHALRLMDSEYCRPFDRNRQGLSLGEGAAILILEDYDRAEQRGATIYAEILGYATNSDAVHITSPDAGGMGRVMAKALEYAGAAPEDVDYINAHGTATPKNDRMETRAIKNVFGKHAAMVSVSSTKSMVGHCLGASGAIECLATVLALYEQIVPPTIHYEVPDPECDLDYVPNISRKQDIHIAVTNSFAFGGNNSALVLRRV